MSEDSPILEIDHLEKFYNHDIGALGRILGKDKQTVHAVDDVSIDLHANEVIGIIGESGCGKTTLLQTMMGLTGKTSGQIRYRGNPMEEFTKREWKEFRQNVQIVFQDPFTALDPKLTVRDSLMEPLKVHGIGDRDAKVEKALKRAELSPPDKYLNRRPGQLSGGEKQRVSIARALVLEPEILLADEPVSMLDVSIQASILNLLSRIRERSGMSMIYISHDLSTVSYVCDTINVMYLGRVVETAPTLQLINEPKHPYTQALINAIPIPDPDHHRVPTDLPGQAQEKHGLRDGCRFRDRCPERMDICDVTPKMVPNADGLTDHTAACHLYYDHEAEVAESQQPVVEHASSSDPQ